MKSPNSGSLHAGVVFTSSAHVRSVSVQWGGEECGTADSIPVGQQKLEIQVVVLGQHQFMDRLLEPLHSWRSLGHDRANKGGAPTNSRRRCRGGYARRRIGLYTSPAATASGTRATENATTGTMMQTQPRRNSGESGKQNKERKRWEERVCIYVWDREGRLALVLSRTVLALFFALLIPKPLTAAGSGGETSCALDGFPTTHELPAPSQLDAGGALIGQACLGDFDWGGTQLALACPCNPLDKGRWVS